MMRMKCHRWPERRKLLLAKEEGKELKVDHHNNPTTLCTVQMTREWTVTEREEEEEVVATKAVNSPPTLN